MALAAPSHRPHLPPVGLLPTTQHSPGWWNICFQLHCNGLSITLFIQSQIVTDRNRFSRTLIPSQLLLRLSARIDSDSNKRNLWNPIIRNVPSLIAAVAMSDGINGKWSPERSPMSRDTNPSLLIGSKDDRQLTVPCSMLAPNRHSLGTCPPALPSDYIRICLRVSERALTCSDSSLPFSR